MARLGSLPRWPSRSWMQFDSQKARAVSRHDRSKVFAAAWSEFERLRQLVPERADWHLHNWGIWRRGEHLTNGYDSQSAGLSCGGISGEDAFVHLCEPNDDWAAQVCDAIIDELPSLYRMAISNVYEASVWQFRTTAILENALLEGAAMFWGEAVRRDLT